MILHDRDETIQDYDEAIRRAPSRSPAFSARAENENSAAVGPTKAQKPRTLPRAPRQVIEV